MLKVWHRSDTGGARQRRDNIAIGRQLITASAARETRAQSLQEARHTIHIHMYINFISDSCPVTLRVSVANLSTLQPLVDRGWQGLLFYIALLQSAT